MSSSPRSLNKPMSPYNKMTNGSSLYNKHLQKGLYWSLNIMLQSKRVNVVFVIQYLVFLTSQRLKWESVDEQEIVSKN